MNNWCTKNRFAPLVDYPCVDSIDHVDNIEKHVLGDNTSTVEASLHKQGTQVNKWNENTVKTCKQSTLTGELTYVNVNNELQVHNSGGDTSNVSIVNRNNTQSVIHDYDNYRSKLSQETGDLWLNNHSKVQNHVSTNTGRNPHASSQVTMAKGNVENIVCELNADANAAIQLHNDTQIMASMEASIEDNVPIWVSVNSKREKMQQASQVKDFCLWKSQTKGEFGFIPLSPLLGDKNCQEKSHITCPILAHNQVKKSGKHNFQGEKILLDSQLNAKNWEKYLSGYWDWQLIQIIKFGFPLDCDEAVKLKCDFTNHKSAILYPEHVDMYLNEEINFKAIQGPFNSPPFPDMHCSPFITREKPNSNKRRVIVDLSWPMGNAVNDGVAPDTYLGTSFILTYPSIDDITDQVVRLGRGCCLYKIDISRAFRHVKMDPGYYNKLGLKWNDFFFDSCLAFGFRHGSSIFQRISDAVRYIMLKYDHHIINYCDDLIGYGLPSKIQQSFNTLCKILGELGLTISETKLVAPSTSVVCLGVLINTVEGTISVPPDKLEKIKAICVKWGVKTKTNKRELQSLLGSLLHVTKCVKNARFFLNRMLGTLRNAADPQNIELDQEFGRDLRWFQEFLPHFNGVCLYSHKSIEGVVQVDAFLQGLGGRWGDQVYQLSIPDSFFGLGIVQLEMLNVFLALRVWATVWAGHKVKFQCDNEAVVSVLRYGKTKDPILAAYGRNIRMLAAYFDIELFLIHIPGIQNSVADLLSRWDATPQNFQVLQQYVSCPIWMQVSRDMLCIDWSI